MFNSEDVRMLQSAYASVYEAKECECEEEDEEKEEKNGKHKEGKHPKGKEEKGEKEMNEEKWIQKAIKKPGALHKQLGVPEGEKIPAGKLEAAAKKGGKLGQRARLAQTLKGLKEEEIFDAILSHLISEGYADNATSAVAIMANMSEEWRDTILEAQSARENPEKYEKEENKKYEKVRGEKRPMPPRGHKDREAFEKWYASQRG